MKSRDGALRVAGPLALILLWELATRAGWLDARFYPAPTKILVALVDLALSGEWFVHLAASLGRVAMGFILGSAVGLCLGAILGVNRYLRLTLEPVVTGLYALPKTALLPLILLMFGLGETGRVVLIAFSVFLLVTVNTLAGVMSVEEIYRDVGRHFGARGLRYLTTIVIPASLPQIMTGLQLALGTAFILIVVAEFVGTQRGLGYLTWQSWQIFSVARMYVGLVSIGILGAVLALLGRVVEKWLIPWRSGPT